jgi:hypothetical protein
MLQERMGQAVGVLLQHGYEYVQLNAKMYVFFARCASESSCLPPLSVEMDNYYLNQLMPNLYVNEEFTKILERSCTDIFEPSVVEARSRSRYQTPRFCRYPAQFRLVVLVRVFVLLLSCAFTCFADLLASILLLFRSFQRNRINDQFKQLIQSNRHEVAGLRLRLVELARSVNSWLVVEVC